MRESIHLTAVHPVAGARALESRHDDPAVSAAADDSDVPSTRPQLMSVEGGAKLRAALQAERALIYLSRQPRDDLAAFLGERGWRVQIARSVSDASRLIRSDAAAAGLIDLAGGFTNRDLGALEGCLRRTNIGWVAVTPSAQLDDLGLRRMIRNYCFDYVKMPCSNDQVNFVLGHAYGMITLCDFDLAQSVAASGDDEMVGTCDAMQQLFRTIRKLGNTDASVFIAGESGTGKELTALAIHERSERRKAPFVPINCGAIPHHLLQSELFGYERGAFTCANQGKIGRVESAGGGTLFLDEIGDLPLESQASLLRFLQEGRIERLGGRDSIAVDVRIISATHVDLEAAMQEGRFRADLFHRLCVVRVDEPPLRARGKDIEILAHHVLQKFRSDSARKIRGFTASAIEAMYNYGWPGNVREMINRVRRAIVMAEGRLIAAEDLGLDTFTSQLPVTLAQAREDAERKAIQQALLRHRHRLNEAAMDLGISRVTLYRLMGTHGLRDTDDKSGDEEAE